MPTGYACDIENGDGISFKEYVMKCARAFGACITMRDDPMDKAIPNEFNPGDYHIQRIKNAEIGLKELEKMTENQIKAQAKKDFDKSLASIDESIKKEEKIANNYERMKKEVLLWTPPTSDHIELKNFMLQQIKVSTDMNMLEVYKNNRRELEIKSVDQWYKERRDSLLYDLSYHTKEHKAEVDRCDNRTKWVSELRNSLK